MANAQTGWLNASDFNLWSLPQGSTPAQGTINWSPNSSCTVSSGNYQFQAFRPGRRITIVDANPAHTETVTPVTVTVGPSNCQVTANMQYTHYTYSVVSASQGLQEALDYQAKLGTAMVLVTPAWTAAGGTTGKITSALGYSNVSILDGRNSDLCSYTWNGSAYASIGCIGSGGGGGSISLTTSGVSGAATLTSGVLNIPNYSAGQAVGASSIAVGGTVVAISAPSVTSTSNIVVAFDESLSTSLGVTCNTTFAQPFVSSRTPGTGFTISVSAAPATNPLCFSYFVAY